MVGSAKIATTIGVARKMSWRPVLEVVLLLWPRLLPRMLDTASFGRSADLHLGFGRRPIDDGASGLCGRPTSF